MRISSLDMSLNRIYSIFMYFPTALRSIICYNHLGHRIHYLMAICLVAKTSILFYFLFFSLHFAHIKFQFFDDYPRAVEIVYFGKSLAINNKMFAMLLKAYFNFKCYRKLRYLFIRAFYAAESKRKSLEN